MHDTCTCTRACTCACTYMCMYKIATVSHVSLVSVFSKRNTSNTKKWCVAGVPPGGSCTPPSARERAARMQRFRSSDNTCTYSACTHSHAHVYIHVRVHTPRLAPLLRVSSGRTKPARNLRGPSRVKHVSTHLPLSKCSAGQVIS